MEACVSRQAGAFSKVDKSEWTNWCKGSPARLQMRREALCASGIRIPHQVAPAAAAIRQVNDQSFTVSPSTFVSSPHPLHRALRGDVTGCESWSQGVKRSGSQKNVQTSSLRPSSTVDWGPQSRTSSPSSPTHGGQACLMPGERDRVVPL